MLKIFPKYLNFENISKKCIRVPGPLKELEVYFPLKRNWLLFKNSFRWFKGLLIKKEKNSLSDLSLYNARKSFSGNESYITFSLVLKI